MTTQMNHISTIAALAIAAIGLQAQTTKQPPELSETLAWMDNTYNPHQETSSLGRGQYHARDNSPLHLPVTLLSEETFKYIGDQLTLVHRDYARTDLIVTSSWTFHLRDINPQSIKLQTYAFGAADISFSTRLEAPIIDKEMHFLYPKEQGKYRESMSKFKATQAYFQVDDAEYGARFLKAFRHAVELSGGRPDPF
jgi:hypothetical protein